MTKNLNSAELAQQTKLKKAYQPPQLFTYGNVREITKNVGNSGASDGGAGANKKTQP